MPDLPPFARISAAIEKLERLKAESTPGPWAALAYLFAPVHGDEAVRIDTPEVDSDRNVAESVTPADGDLIVAMCHPAVIDMVLRRLHLAKHDAEHGRDPWAARSDAAVDAILGGES